MALMRWYGAAVLELAFQTTSVYSSYVLGKCKELVVT